MNDAAKTRFDPRAKISLHTQFADHLAGKPIVPVNVEISPCGYCNATCSGCWYVHGAAGSHRNVVLEINRLKLFLRECWELGVKSVTWTGGGEPSLYKWFSLAVEEAHRLGLEQGLFTNALSYPSYGPEFMQWIRVTMTDRPWKREFIEPLRVAKTLGFAFNYAGEKDLFYLKDTLELAEQVKADYVQVRPSLKFNGETVDIEPPKIVHPLLYITGYKFEDAKKKHGYSTCEGFHFSPFCWEDGNIDVCAYHRGHGVYTLGNIYRQSFKEIIDLMPPSVAVRPDCQVCCKLHEINKTVAEAREIRDVNFP